VRPRAKALAFSTAGAAVMLGCVAALNVLASLVHARLDLSSGKIYSLSSGTRETLHELSDTLLIRVYYTPRLPGSFGAGERYLRDLLAEYSAASPRVRVEYAAPTDEARKLEARAAGVVPVPIQVMSRDRFEAKEAYMGAALLYKGKTSALPVIRDSADLEYDLTRQIRALAQTKRRTVGFLTGHGERLPSDADLAPFFEPLSERSDVVMVSVSTGPVAQGVDALWILAPARPLSDAELDRLRAFADSGKTIGMLLNRRSVSFASFGAVALEQRSLPRWLKDDWGVEEKPGFVVDAQAEKIQLETQVGGFIARRYQDYYFIPVVDSFNPDNPAVKWLRGVSFPFVHPIVAVPGSQASYSSLADTSRDSWYNEGVNAAPIQTIDKLQTGERGPFSITGVSTRKTGGRLILVGSGYILDPRAAGKAGAMALLANLIDWSFKDEALLSIRAKGIQFRPLRPLSEPGRAAAKWLLILTLPCALCAAGAASFERQRRRRAETAARYGA